MILAVTVFISSPIMPTSPVLSLIKKQEIIVPVFFRALCTPLEACRKNPSPALSFLAEQLEKILQFEQPAKVIYNAVSARQIDSKKNFTQGKGHSQRAMFFYRYAAEGIRGWHRLSGMYNQMMSNKKNTL